jgi:Spy/CpxP family protein refolding chaperone
MLSTICKTRHFTNLTKARVLKASCTTIVAGTLFVCVASVSLCAQAQIAPRRPVQKPEGPPLTRNLYLGISQDRCTRHNRCTNRRN